MSSTAITFDPPAIARRFTRLRRAHEQIYAVLKSAVQVFAIRVAGAALAYVSMVFLARVLGARDFGIYAYVSVVVMLLGIAFSFGFNTSAVRFVASYLARGKQRRLAGFLKQSFALVAGLSVLGAMIGAGLVLALRDLIAPYYVAPLLIGMLCVPLWALLNQFEATARALGWINTAFVPNYILRPLLLVAGVGAIVLAGGKPDAIGAICALIGGCGVAVLVQGVLVYSGVRSHLREGKPAFHTRHWFTISLSFLMIDGFRMLLDNTDVLLIGKLLDPDAVAVYFAVIRTGGLVAFVSFSVIALAVPKFAEIHSTGTREDLQKLVSNVIQLMFWPSLLAAGALALIGPYILELFGTDFGAGYPTMLVVLAGLVLRAASGPVEYLLSMTGHQRDTLRVYAVAAIANIALNLVLIPALGIIGAAIGSYVAMLGANAWLYVLVRKRLGVSAFVLPFRTQATRAVVRAAA